jgi:hypothetical protein
MEGSILVSREPQRSIFFYHSHVSWRSIPGLGIGSRSAYDPATGGEGGMSVAKYLIRALRQLRVGDTLRQPGELVPEAVEWANLRSYESLAWVERVPVPEDYQGEGAIEYPPPAAQSKLADILEPERKPTPVVVAGKRKTKTSVAIRCVNCRKSNHLPSTFAETATWLCWDCAQPQTILRAREHPAPTSLAEVGGVLRRSLRGRSGRSEARRVDGEGRR